MPQPSSETGTSGDSAESSLLAADVADLDHETSHEWGRIVGLTLGGVVLIAWAVIEAPTPIAAMAAALTAVLPWKAAVRRYLALGRHRAELLPEPEAKARPEGRPHHGDGG